MAGTSGQVTYHGLSRAAVCLLQLQELINASVEVASTSQPVAFAEQRHIWLVLF
jgi:hypothetical protein